MRQPSTQVSARAYLHAVRGYQTFGRPLSARFIQCRYRQTCSRYSAEAVERFGLARGLNLTFRRLLSCRKSAVEQTYGPVNSQILKAPVLSLTLVK